MLKLIKNLRRDESGQDLIEYSLVAALIALAAVASMQGVATAITGAFNKIAGDLVVT